MNTLRETITSHSGLGWGWEGGTFLRSTILCRDYELCTTMQRNPAGKHSTFCRRNVCVCGVMVVGEGGEGEQEREVGRWRQHFIYINFFINKVSLVSQKCCIWRTLNEKNIRGNSMPQYCNSDFSRVVKHSIAFWKVGYSLNFLPTSHLGWAYFKLYCEQMLLKYFRKQIIEKYSQLN